MNNDDNKEKKIERNFYLLYASPKKVQEMKGGSKTKSTFFDYLFYFFIS